MTKKVSKVIIMFLVTAAILTLPSSVLQASYAQTNANFKDTVLSMHNNERDAVKVPRLTWNDNLAAAAQAYANQLASKGYVCIPGNCPGVNSVPPLPHGAKNENLSLGWRRSSIRLSDSEMDQREVDI